MCIESEIESKKWHQSEKKGLERIATTRLALYIWWPFYILQQFYNDYDLNFFSSSIKMHLILPSLQLKYLHVEKHLS